MLALSEFGVVNLIVKLPFVIVLPRKRATSALAKVPPVAKIISFFWYVLSIRLPPPVVVLPATIK